MDTNPVFRQLEKDIALIAFEYEGYGCGWYSRDGVNAAMERIVLALGISGIKYCCRHGRIVNEAHDCQK